MKHTILFLAANPRGTDRVDLDREARAIQAVLERSGFRDSFVLETRWAAEPLDLLRELSRLKPTIVHFSGHGGDSATGTSQRDTPSVRNIMSQMKQATSVSASSARSGLFFQGADGCPQLVSAEALARVFDAAGSSVKLVVLNACYSELQAGALLTHVDCVVGMHGSIRDDAARNFAIGFYGGLGERGSVAAAYKQGCAAIAVEGLSDGDRPQLKSRSGVDAAQLVLASIPQSRPNPPRPARWWLRFAAWGATAAAVTMAIFMDRNEDSALKVDSVLNTHILTSDPNDPDSPQTVRVVMRPVVDGRRGDVCFAQASESRSFADAPSGKALEEGNGVFEDDHGCGQDKWNVLIPLAERPHIKAWRGWVRIALRRGNRIFESEPVAVEATTATEALIGK